jgi:hypothetical protein
MRCFSFIFLLPFNLNSQLIDTNPALNKFLMLLIENGILDERINSDREIAKELCTANGIPDYKLRHCSTISKAIAMIPEDWDWDYFKANGQWRCRSIKTGRFAEDYNCRNDPKDDDRWSNN